MTTHEQQIDNAIADPTRFYASPMDVLHDDELDTDQKRRILESWKKDAELLSTAQDENMSGGERAQVQDVSLALTELDRVDSPVNDRG